MPRDAVSRTANVERMNGVKAVVGCGSIGEVVRAAEDRSRWRYIVANINIQDSALR